MSFDNSIINLSRECISNFNSFEKNDWVVKPSIPILFFGDLKEFKKSKFKVVTVGLNPSDNEFKETRFNITKDILKRGNEDRYLNTLSNYFKNNPYNWFNHEIENLLNRMDASLYNNKINTALHTDLCTPIATDPNWFVLQNKINPKTLKRLSDSGFELWLKLMNYLKPNIILMSVGRDHFETKSPFNSVKWENFEIIKKKKGDLFTFPKDTWRQNIRRLPNIGNSRVYHIINFKGTAFGHLKVSRCPQAAKLILKNYSKSFS